MSALEDLAEEVRQMMDNAAVVMVGEQPETKPAPAGNPKPTVGYTVVCPGWDPTVEPIKPWTLRSLKEVRADRAASVRIIPGQKRRVIVKVEIKYTIVDGGDCDGR